MIPCLCPLAISVISNSYSLYLWSLGSTNYSGEWCSSLSSTNESCLYVYHSLFFSESNLSIIDLGRGTAVFLMINYLETKWWKRKNTSRTKIYVPQYFVLQHFVFAFLLLTTNLKFGFSCLVNCWKAYIVLMMVLQNMKDNPPCNTLFIGNLGENVNEEELRGLFSV